MLVSGKEFRRIDLIVIHHTASNEKTHTWEEIRQWHLNKGWRDIGYHYGVVFDDGEWKVKAGRDETTIGAHAKGFNMNSIGIAVEGNYETDDLPEEAFTLLRALCANICARMNLNAKKVIKGHRELPYPTACPGKNMPLDRLRDAVAGTVIAG